MNDEKSDDGVDAKMYGAYSCVDCGQEFDSRKELEDHGAKYQNLSRTGRQ